MSKKFLTIIGVLLVVVVVIWIGVSVYSSAFEVDVNPNAEQFVPKIQPSFDMDIIDEVTERTKILPVSPKVFHELKYDDSEVDYDIEDEVSGGEEDDSSDNDENSDQDE